MTNIRPAVSVNKNCEILSMKEEKPGQYELTVKFSNRDREFVTPLPLHIKGSPENVIQIIGFLGTRYGKNEITDSDLSNPLMDRVVFEKQGKNIVGHDQDKILLNEKAPELNSKKAKDLFQKCFAPSISTPNSISSSSGVQEIEIIRGLWLKTNSNRKLRTSDRVKKKISDLHHFVRNVAQKKGISKDKINTAINATKHLDNLNEILNSYREKYLPELNEELSALQKCEECHKHFSI